MATKKTNAPASTPAKSTKSKAPAKGAKGATGKAKVAAAPKAKPAPKAKVQNGPLARLKAAHGTKEGLVGTLVEPLTRVGEDAEALRGRLLKASNQQLLRLAKAVETVTKKYGSRSKLVEALGKAYGAAKDKDYLAKLESYSLPRLLDLVVAAERRSKRASA
jgi:hypothetical protein